MHDIARVAAEMAGIHTLCDLMSYVNKFCRVLFLPSRKARQLILTPKSPSVCIYVYMSVTVSYRPRSRLSSTPLRTSMACVDYIYVVV